MSWLEYPYLSFEQGEYNSFYFSEEILRFAEAKEMGIQTKPVLTGAFTFLKLAKYQENRTADDYADAMIAAYREILTRFEDWGLSGFSLMNRRWCWI